jgi:hypothetical protein
VVASCVVLCVLEMMSCELLRAMLPSWLSREARLTWVKVLRKCGVGTLMVLPA